MEKIENLWASIAEFETRERKNDSKNPILANARQGARMQAYVGLMEMEIVKNE